MHFRCRLLLFDVGQRVDASSSHRGLGEQRRSARGSVRAAQSLVAESTGNSVPPQTFARGSISPSLARRSTMRRLVVCGATLVTCSSDRLVAGWLLSSRA
jgi:hypothetical protein